MSGTAPGHRPGVLELQEAAFAGRINVVLVTGLSRGRAHGAISRVRVVGVQTAMLRQKARPGVTRASLRPVLDFERPHGNRPYKVCANTTNGASRAGMITRMHLSCCLFHAGRVSTKLSGFSVTLP